MRAPMLNCITPFLEIDSAHDLIEDFDWRLYAQSRSVSRVYGVHVACRLLGFDSQASVCPIKVSALCCRSCVRGLHRLRSASSTSARSWSQWCAALVELEPTPSRPGVPHCCCCCCCLVVDWTCLTLHDQARMLPRLGERHPDAVVWWVQRITSDCSNH